MDGTTSPTYPPAGGKLPSEHDGFAITSLVTAFFVPILGIIFGHLSNRRAKLAHRGRSGLAVAGLVVGYPFTVVTALIIVGVVAAAGTTPSSVSADGAPPSQSPPAAPSQSLSGVDYGQQYTADMTPWGNASDAASKARSNKQNITAYTQLSDIEQSTAAKMLRQAWPSSAEADIQAFAEALSVESGDEAAVAGDFKIDPTAHSTGDAISYTDNASSLSNDSNNLQNDSDKTNALAQKCLADLGFSSGS